LAALGSRSPFVIDPSKAHPPTLADLYTATATGDAPAVLVTVTDRKTGATAREAPGGVLVLTVPSAVSERVAERLLRDARTIIGIARRKTGRPAVGTGLQPSQVIAVVVELWNPEPPPEGTPPTEDDVARELGTSVRTIRRKGELLPGPDKAPWERLLRDARIARRFG
jgi:hypothetical protein